MRREYLKIAQTGIDDKLQDNGSDYLSRYRECQQLLGTTIGEIMLDLQGKPFRNIAGEIGFYKEDAPHIWGLYMFYQELVKIEAARKFESPETFQAGLRARLEQTEKFFNEHHWICAYYYEGCTDKDDELFTRRGTHSGKDPIIDIRIDRDFTRGASLLSLMRQNELLRDWLNSELKAASHDRLRIKLKWEGTQVALIELLKSMHLKGDFGEVAFQLVMDWASQEFGVNTKNHDQVLQNMKGRYDTTAHLKDLLKVMNEDFIGPTRKK